jgi:hypothetical protein
MMERFFGKAYAVFLKGLKEQERQGLPAQTL